MEFLTSDAESALQKALYSVGKNTRIVICGAPEEQEMLQEQINYSKQSPTEIIKASSSIEAQAWLEKRKTELIEDFAEDDYGLKEIEGSWPGALDGHRISMHRNILNGELLEKTVMAKLAVQSPWDIPAHFKYGNWNNCPAPEVHCAVWKHWYNKFGAEIVSMSHDVIEAWVARPPGSEEEAMALAWEQFLYCDDIVFQGVGTIGNLAGMAMHSNYWYFWWD